LKAYATISAALLATLAGIVNSQTASAPELLAARALGNTPLFEDLQELCDHIGGRPTGSPAADRAINWGFHKFQAAGLFFSAFVHGV
jgi:hypothetical protein